MMKTLSQNTLVKKIKDFFILEAEEGEFEEVQHQQPEKAAGSKVIPFSDKSHRSSVSINDPKSADEARKAADELRGGTIVVVNISCMEKDMAREYLDFLSGAAYAINGNYKKVGNGVFLFSPNGIPINELEDQGSTKEDEVLMFKDI